MPWAGIKPITIDIKSIGTCAIAHLTMHICRCKRISAFKAVYNLFCHQLWQELPIKSRQSLSPRVCLLNKGISLHIWKRKRPWRNPVSWIIHNCLSHWISFINHLIGWISFFSLVRSWASLRLHLVVEVSGSKRENVVVLRFTVQLKKLYNVNLSFLWYKIQPN